ncbi:MAG: hypothetical protein IJR17_01450 [Clostridia bacterium]|nr:hypothetical protein [Clostridia bacterium]
MERSEKSWRSQFMGGSPIHGEANSFNDLHLTVHELPCGHEMNLAVRELTAIAVMNCRRGAAFGPLKSSFEFLNGPIL